MLPQAGTRQPGELWLNFADFALGFIDASQAAQKLLAVRWFVPTATYAVGDFVLYSGNLYRALAPSSAGAFVAANWSKVGTAADLTAMQAYVDAGDAARLPLAGGTLTGPLVLGADPSAALGATTKQYVDTGVAAANASAASKVPLAGGTMTGALILSGSPTQNLQAATKAYVDAGAFLPIAGGTLTGPLTLAADPTAALGAATKQYADTKLPLAGDVSGGSAAAGQIGEVMSVTSSSVTLGNGVTSNLVGLNLTAGDWDVQGEVWIGVGTGCTAVIAAIGTVSGTIPGAPLPTTSRNQVNLSAGNLTGTQILPLKTCHISISVTIVVYIMAQCSFTGGSATATGNIWARRAR